LFECAEIEGIISHRIGDVRQFERLRRALTNIRPHYIFHLAAQSLVRRSYRLPLETLETNVLGTAHMLEAVRRMNRPCIVVVVTSDKCYENRGCKEGYRECDPMGGHDPYSMSKGCAELVTSSWRRSFFGDTPHIRVATARSGNVIGGGDWSPDRILTDCIAALTRNRPVPVRNPDATRPWQHVLEPLGGYLKLAARMARRDGRQFCEAWNFGPPDRDVRSVAEVVEEVIRRWGRGSWKRAGGQRSAPHEAAWLALSCEKARRRLGWRPVWTFPEAVEKTVEWYGAWSTGKDDLQALCMQQIREYERGLNAEC
jgi:CDP-glucose 4,6-dehydratase